MQQIYLKRMTKQDITKSVAVCTDSVDRFWGVSNENTLDYMPIKICNEKEPTYFPKGITIHKGYQGEKDWRITGSEFKQLYADYTPQEQDIMCVRKINSDTFMLSIVKKENPLYTILVTFLKGTDNYAIIDVDDFTTQDEEYAQKIYYGCPGSGKSHHVKEITENVDSNFVFRTTFHPDTDYASFVGCYKPRMNDGVIEYSFTPQIFTNAYIKAWEDTSKPVYLIIEEINRGNCAQIFGDLFQLLDRDKVTGKSEYPIKADKDLVAHIEKVLGVGHEGIKNGELCLPPNLIIYATMNTSDQSLFPMDSAFKRRWDWEYVPINYSKDIVSGKFIIEIDDDTKYSWVEFLESVNDKIYDATNSEDKQMGNFFIKKSIKANEFVNKVMFYLWNEVCKEEYGTQRNFFRKGKEGKTEFKFTELFGDNQATILKEFMTSLGVEPIGKNPEEPAAE